MGEPVQLRAMPAPVQAGPGTIAAGRIGVGETAAGLIAIGLVHADGSTLTALLDSKLLDRFADLLAALIERRTAIAAGGTATLQ